VIACLTGHAAQDVLSTIGRTSSGVADIQDNEEIA
jgi:hypothetical protein